MQKDPVQPGSRPQVSGLGRLFRRRSVATLPPACPASVEVEGVDLPICSDWGWRPDLWSNRIIDGSASIEEPGTRIGAEASVFHDASTVNASIAQASGDGSVNPAPFGVTLDIGAFDGSFLSLVLDLPGAGASGLLRRHLVGVSLDLLRAPGQQMFARFNLRHGPNTEQLLREIPQAEGGASRQVLEFDLAYIEMNEKRVTGAWIDLILQDPANSRTAIRDLVVYRRPRADL